jgi:hypothetical protein
MKIPLPIPIPFPDWDEIIPPPRSPTRRDRPHHRSLLRYQLQKEKRREVRWGLGGSHPEEEETKPLLLAPENLQKFLFPLQIWKQRERESWASARLSGDDELRDPLALQSRERALATGTRLSESARGRKLS